MTDGVFGLAMHEIVDELEGVLQLAGPVHREPRSQEGEQQDDDERDQDLHHHEVGPGTRSQAVCPSSFKIVLPSPGRLSLKTLASQISSG